MSELGRALAAWLLGQGVTEDICGTSVERKWFGEASGPLTELGTGSDARRTDRNASTRPRANERTRPLRAATLAFALVGAVVFVFCLFPPKRSPASVLAVSRREPAMELGPNMDSPTPPSGQTPAEPSLADSHPPPRVARPTPAAIAANTNEPRSSQTASRTTTPHKATSTTASATDLGLIAPY